MINTERRIQTLVVDDNRAHRDAMLMTLEKLGHATQQAATVADASALLKAHGFDLVIIDMELPRGRGEPARQEHGLEVIRHARAADPDAA
ncbi:MAG: response regulator, partial [Candidatus Krumholzibacteriia bacterium]